MKKDIILKGLLAAILALLCVVLYWNGDYVVYMLTYIFSFAVLLCYTIAASSGIMKKVIQSVMYALILAAQILYAVFVVRPVDGMAQAFALYRLLGVLLLFVPFLIRQLWRLRV